MNERIVISLQAWPDEYVVFVEKEDEETFNCEFRFYFFLQIMFTFGTNEGETSNWDDYVCLSFHMDLKCLLLIQCWQNGENFGNIQSNLG